MAQVLSTIGSIIIIHVFMWACYPLIPEHTVFPNSILKSLNSYIYVYILNDNKTVIKYLMNGRDYNY